MKVTDVLLYFGIWSVIMTVLWVVVAIHSWISSAGGVKHDDLRESSHKAHCRIDDLHTKCLTVEQQMKTAPTHADLNEVVAAVGRIGGDVRNLQGQLGGISSGMLRVEKSLDTLTEHQLKESQ